MVIKMGNNLPINPKSQAIKCIGNMCVCVSMEKLQKSIFNGTDQGTVLVVGLFEQRKGQTEEMTTKNISCKKH